MSVKSLSESSIAGMLWTSTFASSGNGVISATSRTNFIGCLIKRKDCTTRLVNSASVLLNTSTESTEMVSSFGESSSLRRPDTSSNNDNSLALSKGPSIDTRNSLSIADEALTDKKVA